MTVDLKFKKHRTQAILMEIFLRGEKMTWVDKIPDSWVKEYVYYEPYAFKSGIATDKIVNAKLNFNGLWAAWHACTVNNVWNEQDWRKFDDIMP